MKLVINEFKFDSINKNKENMKVEGTALIDLLIDWQKSQYAQT